MLCRNLEGLIWEFDASLIPLSSFRFFFSSYLKHLSLSLSTCFSRSEVSSGVLASLTGVLSRLPASLEHLIIKCGQGEGPLKDAMSSFIYQCGPFLARFASSERLPEAAFNCLMQLPNLRSWVAVHEPLRTLPLVTFPSFQELHLLAPHGDGQLQDGLVPLPPTILNTNIKETLKILACLEYVLVDSTLLHSASAFRNLVTLRMRNDHCDMGESCIYYLTDDDVENLAVALSSTLRFGRACSFNTCRTSVSSCRCPSTVQNSQSWRSTSIHGQLSVTRDACSMTALDVTNRDVGLGICRMGTCRSKWVRKTSEPWRWDSRTFSRA